MRKVLFVTTIYEMQLLSLNFTNLHPSTSKRMQISSLNQLEFFGRKKYRIYAFKRNEILPTVNVVFLCTSALKKYFYMPCKKEKNSSSHIPLFLTILFSQKNSR